MRRLALFVTAFLIAFIVAAPAAMAWSNGGDDGDGFGTHDWVLQEAIRLAGPDGAWVDAETALLATDDPDKTGNPAAHSFRARGLFALGCAPQEISDLYAQAAAIYAAGDRAEASRILGLLSHDYSDILQPFHSSYAALSHTAYHLPYELAVYPLTRRPGQNRGWVTATSRKPMLDVRAKTVAAARFSRARFPALIAGLKATPDADVSQHDVQAVTQEMLSRGANDLADIIAGIAHGDGVSAPPKRIALTVTRRYDAPGSRIGVYAVCTDAAGKPIEGVTVTFRWPTAAGATVDTIAFTGSSGMAYSWKTVDRLRPGSKAWVQVVTTSSGSTTTASSWFVPSIALASGTAGLRASMSNTAPRHETITARAVARDRAGRPVSGLPVTFSWRFRSLTYTQTVRSGTDGVARLSRYIGVCSPGYRVRVTVRARSQYSMRTAVTSFVPR